MGSVLWPSVSHGQSDLAYIDNNSRLLGEIGQSCEQRWTRQDADSGGNRACLGLFSHLRSFSCAYPHIQDAAFYPSVYGESLTKIMQLQASSYPNLMVPVILPFLADGILALGGTQSEGIFRVPGDADSVSELKSRMDRGHYQLVSRDYAFPTEY